MSTRLECLPSLVATVSIAHIDFEEALADGVALPGHAEEALVLMSLQLFRTWLCRSQKFDAELPIIVLEIVAIP